jgi:hypothetical protein
MFRLRGKPILTPPQFVLLGLSLFSAAYRAPQPELFIFYLTGAMLGLHLGLDAVRWLYPYCRRLPFRLAGVWLGGIFVAAAVRPTTAAITAQFVQTTGLQWPVMLLMLACLSLLMAAADRQVADVVRLHQRYA